MRGVKGSRIQGVMYRQKKRSKGFTLIEIIIVIVMAGILLPAIIVPFIASVKGSGKPEMAGKAMYLAKQKMEEFMKFEYGNPALNPVNLTPYAAADLPNYQWRWERLYVPSNNLMAAGSVNPPDTGYKRIRVLVRDPENSTYEVYSVVTNFP
ncbi:MAG: type II secretion system protein [Deltaproteobacteria bacterium]|nr:type II secretion system protein [Deltaproteobacteria bacterium]